MEAIHAVLLLLSFVLFVLSVALVILWRKSARNTKRMIEQEKELTSWRVSANILARDMIWRTMQSKPKQYVVNPADGVRHFLLTKDLSNKFVIWNPTHEDILILQEVESILGRSLEYKGEGHKDAIIYILPEEND